MGIVGLAYVRAQSAPSLGDMLNLRFCAGGRNDYELRETQRRSLAEPLRYDIGSSAVLY